MSSSYILSDNGVSSGSAGLKSSAGNDGVLILQTANSSGTATNAVYVDNNQNVGFGVTPDTWTITQALQIGANATYGGAWFGASTSSGGAYVGANNYYNGAFKFKTANQATYYAQNANGSGNHELYVSTNSPTVGGSVTFSRALLVANGYAVTLQGATPATGTGITFPGPQSASTDPNTLDDYEEGTWTPALLFGASAGVTTYGQLNGTYTKVGNVVTVRGYFVITTKSAATGSASLSGLPFPVKNGTNVYATAYIYLSGGASFTGAPMGYMAALNTSCVLGQTNGSSGFSTISNTNFANGLDMIFQSTYLTD